MSKPVTARAAICLNMIVKNGADVVAETLDSVAPYISSWVIVDTGSTDGTPAVIRKHTARLGIPGELCERPWRDFGHNRTEALNLAQGHGDYIWVIDADDIVVGTPDFTQLSADIYRMRLGDASFTYWRPQLFRDGVRVRYAGVVHETAVWEPGCVVGRLEGDYYVESRRLGARSQDTQTYAHDRDLLLAEVERNPEDARSVFYLAQSYFDLGDFANARKWYERRVEMGGSDEEVYYSMLRLAESMVGLEWPWQVVQDVYLQAWEFRPTRAEALHAIARRYREEQRYLPGHLFAQRAAQIPFPETDLLFIRADIYAWRALDEQAVCASQLGKHAEAFMLCRRLLARSDIPDGDRQRIAVNRDVGVPVMLEAAASYPDALVQRLVAGPGAKVVVSLVAGPDRETTEQTLNSFLACCLDVSRVGRFLVLDTGLSAPDRAKLRKRYGFLEFIRRRFTSRPGSELAELHTQIDARYWLHLGQGWQFFAPENLIGRLTAVLRAQPQVFQVGINFADATTLTGTTAIEDLAHRTPDAGRYTFTETLAHGPAMFDTTRLNPATGPHGTKQRSASLDEVLCIQPLSKLGQPDRLIPAQTEMAPEIVRTASLSTVARRLNHGLSGIPLSATPILDVKPVVQMPFHDVQIWSTTGIDPSFQLHLPPGSARIDPGWYVLSVALRPTAGRLSHPKLYRDHGDGFREQDSDLLMLADNTTHHRLLIKVERPIYALRLDPSDSSEVSEFLLGSLRIRRISSQEARDETWLRMVHAVSVALHRGPRGALKNLYCNTHEGTGYSEWIKAYDTLGDSLRAQIRADIFALEGRPLISIILPVYNTPERWLRACLDSVRSQLYGVWELCIADDASTKPHVRRVLQEYAAKDNRIKVVLRKKNGHISAASNDALELASGDYVALLDHDDVLPEHALFHVAQTIVKHPEVRLIYSDEDKIDETGKRFDPYFKPDWNPVLFCGQNMFSHFGVYQLALVRDVGGFREGYEGSQDYDLAFRCIERVARDQIVHIPRVLYHWRAIEGSTARASSAKDYAIAASKKSIDAHFKRQGVEACVTPIPDRPGNWRVSYQLREPEPSVSIIIPTRNGGEVLRRCLNSIRERTDYSNYEIVIVNNQSDEQNTIDLLEREGRRQHQRVIVFDEPFNFSRLNNTAAKQSARDILLFLNDDTEIITAGWLTELVSLAIQPGVGAVGAMLYYPDNHIQHAGIILGLGPVAGQGVAGHAYHRMARGNPGDKCRAQLVQELSAVTAACMAIKRDRFDDVCGFDESLAVAFNDVDLCLRLSQKGYRNVWTPNAELYHHESLTRGSDTA
ncbi:glycosyltransferase, partial [Mycobacterium sp. E3198]|uniref:glycosyltransferase n=1 Tax=Mycobacterium sp. E3198 TaxID=1834143 RepID=UPI0012EAE300